MEPWLLLSSASLSLGWMGGWVSSSLWYSKLFVLHYDFSFFGAHLSSSSSVVGGCRFPLRGCYLAIIVASSSCWPRAYIYSHSHHLQLLTDSPSFASHLSLGGSCKELELEALAKALPALVGVDNCCGPLRSSPHWDFVMATKPILAMCSQLLTRCSRASS